MTLGLLEPAVDLVADYIEDNIAAKVISLNTRYSDTLPDVAAYYRGELPARTPASPSVCVRGSGFAPGIERAANVELTYALDVVIFVGHNDPQRRFDMLCRYTVGLVELVRAAQTPTYRIRLSGNARMTEVLTTEFLQGFIIPFAVKTTESF